MYVRKVRHSCRSKKMVLMSIKIEESFHARKQQPITELNTSTVDRREQLTLILFVCMCIRAEKDAFDY